MLTVEAHAKINLSLEVLAKRPDGFHELISVMQTVTLCDELRVWDAEQVNLACSDPDLETQHNLVLKATCLLREKYAISRGCRIHLQKRIPKAAGLGGGSSDAAATLLALTRLWSIELPFGELVRLAKELGSDVPFFLWGGTALVEGRGERILPLREPASNCYLLVKPNLEVSTRLVFSQLPPSAWTDGATTRRVAAEITASARANTGVNALQETLFCLHPAAQDCFNAVCLLAPKGAIISGSGPTVVAKFPTQEKAREAEGTLQAKGYWTTVSSSCESTGPETLGP